MARGNASFVRSGEWLVEVSGQGGAQGRMTQTACSSALNAPSLDTRFGSTWKHIDHQDQSVAGGGERSSLRNPGGVGAVAYIANSQQPCAQRDLHGPDPESATLGYKTDIKTMEQPMGM